MYVVKVLRKIGTSSSGLPLLPETADRLRDLQLLLHLAAFVSEPTLTELCSHLMNREGGSVLPLDVALSLQAIKDSLISSPESD